MLNMVNIPRFIRLEKPWTLRKAALAVSIGTAIGCGFCTAAFAADQVAASRIKAPEIKSLLAAGARFRSLPLGVSPGATRREYFGVGGAYEGCADRFPLVGTYHTKQDALCTKTNAGESCRELFKASDGGYLQRFPGTHPGSSQPVEITASQHENCQTVGVKP